MVLQVVTLWGGGNFWSNAGIIEFSGKASFARGTQLICGRSGILSFGNNFGSNCNCIFNAGKSVSFGNDCLLSWNVSVLDGDGHLIVDSTSAHTTIQKDSSIVIGNHVWICMNATILKSTNVGNNCVIGANSIINKQIKGDNLVISGINKVVKEGVNWKQ